MKRNKSKSCNGTERTDATKATYDKEATEDREFQRNSGKENLSGGASQVTDGSDEAPPRATRVASLPEAVRVALTMGVGEECLFNFARALKAFEVTTNFRLMLDDYEQAFQLWWTKAKSLLPADADIDEHRFLFYDAVKNARTPLGANPLEEAIARAGKLSAPWQAERYPSARLKRLISVCYHLQKIQGDNPIFLGVRDAQAILGGGNLPFASRMMNGLVHDGVLDIVEKGKPGGRRASRYRFRMEPAPAEPPPSSHSNS